MRKHKRFKRIPGFKIKEIVTEAEAQQMWALKNK